MFPCVCNSNCFQSMVSYRACIKCSPISWGSLYLKHNHIFYKSASICLVTYSTLMDINLIGQCFHLICLVESLVPPLHNAASEAEYHPIPGISTRQCPKDQWFSFPSLAEFWKFYIFLCPKGRSVPIWKPPVLTYEMLGSWWFVIMM